MKVRLKNLLHRFSMALEFIIAGLLCIGILYFTVRMAGSILHIKGYVPYNSFESLLSTAFTLVIGVEIIRMMCEHSSEIVFEVLTFAIARQIIIDHTHAVDNLYGVAAIALIFVIRKFLMPGTSDKLGRVFYRSKKPKAPKLPQSEPARTEEAPAAAEPEVRP
ncbi:MAG: hypothetical protein ACI3VN_10000 [Candidatus Onthomonas sp.]